MNLYATAYPPTGTCMIDTDPSIYAEISAYLQR